MNSIRFYPHFPIQTRSPSPIPIKQPNSAYPFSILSNSAISYKPLKKLKLINDNLAFIHKFKEPPRQKSIEKQAILQDLVKNRLNHSFSDLRTDQSKKPIKKTETERKRDESSFLFSSPQLSSNDTVNKNDRVLFFRKTFNVNNRKDVIVKTGNLRNYRGRFREDRKKAEVRVFRKVKNIRIIRDRLPVKKTKVERGVQVEVDEAEIFSRD